MVDAKPEPKYQWRRTQLDESDPPTDLDWMGYDGALAIGRIRKETNGPDQRQMDVGGLVSENS